MNKGWLGLILVVLIGATVVIWWRLRTPDGPLDPNADPAAMAAQLEAMRTALAETENLNPMAAIPLWESLASANPNDLDSLQNLVVTRLSGLNQLKQTVENANATPEDRSAAELALPGELKAAADDAARLLSKARELEDSQHINDGVWLAGQIEALDATLTSGNDKQAEMDRMRVTALKVAEQLASAPDAIPLVGLLDETATLAQDPLAGPSPEFVSQLAPALISCSQSNPRNLLVALRALQYAIEAENADSLLVLESLREQLQPLRTLVQQRPGSVDVEQVINEAALQIEAGQFRRGQLGARLLENLLRGTAAYDSDLKQIKPNPLDLVATRRINELSSAVASVSEVAPSSNPISFAVPEAIGQLPSAITSVTCFDVDLDDRSEIIATTDNAVFIYQRGEQAWQLLTSIEVPSGVRGCTITDLFLADGDAPRKIVKSFPSDPSLDDNTAARNAKRHKVFPSLLTWGDRGIQIVQFDGRPETPEDQRLLPIESETGLESLGNVLAMTPFDLDADGDLDLAVSVAEQGLRLFVNRDNMTFYEVTEFSRLPTAADPVVDMAIVDWDRDLAVDLLTIQKSGTVGWMKNLLHFQMQWAPLPDIEPLGEGQSIAALEWDGNVSWDALYTSTDGIGLLTTETTNPGQIRPLQSKRWADVSLVTAAPHTLVADLDNDSWLDVVVVDSSGAQVLAGGPRANELSDSNTSPPRTTALDQTVSAMDVAELTGDAGLDLCVGVGDQLLLLPNTTSEIGNFINIQMTGIYDNATGRVNHYAIGSTHELRFGPHYRATVVDSRTTHFGLGQNTSADTLRTILTNGVTQNVIDPEVGVTLIEDQSLKGSCPYLYAWDGEKFAFVTDCLWAAPLGLQYAMGKVLPDRPWEYLKLDGSQIAPKDGFYELRLTEELWEIAYVDHVELIAVDHPAGVEVWTNEKVGPPDVTEHRVFAFDTTRKIPRALDTRGQDVTKLLANRDEQYVQAFDARYLQGLCPPHWIDLDLGEIAADDKAFLLLTGWILPTDTSLNIRIDQNPQLPPVEPPSVWVPGDDGEWDLAIPAMGFPGGKTKTIVVDLSGKLNPRDPRVRIRTSAQIYWDAAALALNPPEVATQSIPLELVSAEVAEHGFSAALPRNSTQPQRYDYHNVRRDAKWPPLAGGLTRFGNVADMLRKWDDEMVVMAGGDEIRLRFRVPDQPIPEGWQRDFILHSVGWDKDADLNTLAGQSSDPLPFRDMRSYPPPRDDQERAQEIEQLNQWHRTRLQPFRKFWQR